MNRAALSLGVAMLVGFSCSRAGAPETALNPCSWLTPAEVRGVLGVTVPPEHPQGLPGGAVSCVWVGPADQAVRLVVYPGGKKDYEAYLRRAVEAWGGRPQLVRGAGDRAVFHAGQLVVWRGGRYFTLSLNAALETAGRLRLSTALARRIVPRM